MAVIEHALLPVRAGSEAAFEAAVQTARPLIEASPGFLSLEIRRPVESGNPYLLLAAWRSVADHRDGFRMSDRYQQWRALLHHFYDPMPEVSYFGEPL
ncbi:antibiotic biosynthesis monooxygenase family protein [Sphingopyxis sp. R3-92]|uniref:antibiotic biosynthesis monooxygenase family protein n=1 Tax=Sphingopyxis sp. R3-92 TaxID=3158553 RepID=UPI003EE718B7